jgi:hypothetical protein
MYMQKMKAAPRTPYPDVVQALYQLHADAYDVCGCSGTVATLPYWVGVYLAGDFIPCGPVSLQQSILFGVMAHGRCGCGS